jgi:hypothetical protein
MTKSTVFSADKSCFRRGSRCGDPLHQRHPLARAPAGLTRTLCSLCYSRGPLFTSRCAQVPEGQGFIRQLGEADFNCTGDLCAAAHTAADTGGEFMAAHEVDLSWCVR